MKLSRVAVSVLVASVAVACSKPKEPTPEITEPAPTTDSATATPAAAPQGTDSSAELSLATVYFDFDSYALSTSAQDELRKVATDLKTKAGTKIQVEGHCDERGSNEYNLALGERRARAIQEFLTSEGVTSADLSTISYGEERPAAQGSSEDAWSKNRRGEFRRM
ncbi:MAG: peptidoglycan-associated lipoprotein Pal [Silvanigrellales bacterium]|jgi:peptidoglycan-associated lipoprotein|nr:peptidoglycan-associated lipoprotein Pal [Silvanigrellales bacterium]